MRKYAKAISVGFSLYPETAELIDLITNRPEYCNNRSLVLRLAINEFAERRGIYLPHITDETVKITDETVEVN